MAIQKERVYFARTNFRGQNKIFGIKLPDRRQHMYVVGKTGTGKTNLIKNIAIQDINSGRGLCVVDPHGELVEELLEKIPKERSKDVIYFNPADSEHPLGFNVLEVPDKKYKHLIAQGLIGIFTKIWANVWSARMEYILNNCILALIETPGTTLLGIQRILTDKDYRQRILANVTDPVVRAFWMNEYEVWQDRFRNEAIVPIQNKVGQFVATSLIRNIVGQAKSSFEVFELMNEGKILLVNISKGRIGEENSMLLGAMLITKIQLAAMERVRIPENERRDFYLYVDEFQNFATESFASILSEARKYRLNLIISHQYTGQLISQTTTTIRDAVFGNVGTMIFFRVGATDAEFLEKEITPEFVIDDLVNLPNYNIYLKLMVDGISTRPFSAVTIPPLATTADMADPKIIVDNSRKQYARSANKVEGDIKRWSSSLPGTTEAEEEFFTEGGSAYGGKVKTGDKFESPCWICKKTASVPFKPDGQRPVYCSECLKKIEAGQLRPLRPLPTAGKEREEFGGELGELGIEFNLPQNKVKTFSKPGFKAPHPEFSPKARPAPGKIMPNIREGELVVKDVKPKRALSLQDLKPRAEKSKPKESNLDELRRVLKESLAKEEKPMAETQKNQNAAPSSQKEPSSKSGVLKPGESIKFE
ncbi:MAG: type IV secretion system DNA-binding domain-containing protein [Patescibacteria group bacterium]